MLGFIIVGWPTRTKQLGTVAPGGCPHCENQSTWSLVKQRRWLTVFWLPVLPLSFASHVLVCDTCGTTIDIDGETVREAKGLIEETQDVAVGELDDATYNEHVADFWTDVNNADAAA